MAKQKAGRSRAPHDGRRAALARAQVEAHKRRRSGFVSSIMSRQMYGTTSQQNASYIGHVFGKMQARQRLLTHDGTSKKHRTFSSVLKTKTRVVEMVAEDNYLFVLETGGLCTAFEVNTGRILCYLNVDTDEYIRSIFYNRVNKSIITVFVREANQNELQCRSIPFMLVRKGKPEEGLPILKSEVFTHPGFIEFDDVNSKVLTFNAKKRLYRVWELRNYEPLYSIDGVGVKEIKVCKHLILVICDTRRSGSVQPMRVLDVETGEVLFQHQQPIHRGVRIDICELFNEFLLVQQAGGSLKICNIKTKQRWEVPRTKFIAPEGFIFLYEKRCFVTIRDKTASVWDFKGNLITRFEDHELMYENSNTNGISITRSQEYIVSYCARRHWNGDMDGTINVSCTSNGRCVAKISREQLRFDTDHHRQECGQALQDVTALVYNEERHEMYTGNQNGDVFMW
eukprot:CAMPEP_0119120112 /NCGR_PEP_ID=MMETSP1310-20130426/1301_1 /TAXON_ID=464262 /ORGANISM="Genus nov. species nov., Strain RCC2339" /LENGTH=453 /DNA_ID=CAMNT_0007109577 /DNA_START=232 /DNA_END=1590 /DNA_ORIENTATION=-